MTAVERRVLSVSVALVWAGAVALIVVAMLNGCSWLSTQARADEKAVIDCTTATARDAVHQFGPVLDALLAQSASSDGKVNWPAIGDVTKGFGLELGSCVLASVVAQALTPAPPKPDAPKSALFDLDPVSLRAGFNAFRAAKLGGKAFKTDAGVL